MNSTITLSTEIWRIQLPGDWTRRESSGRGSAYFESADGTQGAYFSSLRLPTGRTQREELEAISALEVRGLHAMEGRKWEIMDRSCSAGQEACRIVTDAWDRLSGYRIVSQLLASGPWIARMSLHDYQCSDFLRSKQASLAILDSFQMNE